MRWPLTPPISVTQGLPSEGGFPSQWLLTFVQGHRQTLELALQAAAFAARSDARLVQASDLLLHNNNVQLHAATLLRYLARYPHRTRVLIQTSDNAQGYRCGHLQAVASTASAWSPYANVLFLHPDVYLLPRAAGWIEAALAEAAARSTAFLVTSMVWVTPGISGAPPRLSSRGGFFSTDLFAFRPSLLGPNTWSRVCVASASEPADHKLPEHGLWRLIHDAQLPHKILGNRTTSTFGQDAFGVWHSHDPDRVAAYLVEQRLLRLPSKG